MRKFVTPALILSNLALLVVNWSMSYVMADQRRVIAQQMWTIIEQDALLHRSH